ncbi:MAG: GNAT family N-acetyltransferase [Anaerolineae bacterium]|nr:GNAT family N-acetyltransferase [Anaerolineae bacterium]
MTTFPPIFKGKRIRLAAPEPDDAAYFARWSADDAYMRMLDDDPVQPRSEAFFAHFSQGGTEPGRTPDDYYFHLRTLADDQVIGFVALFNIKWPSQHAEIALGIGDPAYRGKGYGADALRVLLNYAFSELNLYRVELSVMAYNTAAITAYERVGFVREGVKRGLVLRCGQRHDVLCYAILRPEWEALPEREANQS